MDYTIRLVDNISKWILDPNSDPRRLIDIDADPIGDLKTKDNELSVFVIDDIAYIEHIIIAYASKRTKFEKLGYVIAEKKELEENDISMKCSPETGGTPDDETNKKHWNLVNLKARDLEKLAKIFIRYMNVNENKGLEFSFSRVKVMQLVKSKIANDDSFKKKVSSKLIDELKKSTQQKGSNII